MSKTKNKTHTETEHLKGEVRKYKSLVRQLRKKIRELERQAHFYEDVVDEVVKDVQVKKVCDSCGKGTLNEIDLIHVILTKCDVCDFKRTRKPKK